MGPNSNVSGRSYSIRIGADDRWVEGKGNCMPPKGSERRDWSRPEAVEALEHLAYRLGRPPTQEDLTHEEPSHSWWYRNYPGGWVQAVKDVTGYEPAPGKQTYQPRSKGRPRFRNHDSAIVTRRTNNLPDSWYGNHNPDVVEI